MPDYVDDFAVQLDLPGDQEEVEEDDAEDSIPMNKAWGKIAENFPIRPPEKKDEKEKMPKDTNLPIGERAT